jgi:Ca2+-binding RTX toxin-like protein
VRKIILLFVLVLGVAALAPAMARAATVAVFDDPNFVDTSDNTGAEADNVQASLASLGHTVKRFDGTSSVAFSRGLAGARLLVIPDLENADLSAALDQNAIHTIRSYVSTGGGLIIFEADDTGRDEGFLNTVFGYDLSSGTNLGAPAALTSNAAGTAFAGGPATLPDHSFTDPLDALTLPSGASVMYQAGDEAWVTAFAVGSGVIVHVAWDWFDAAPAGTENGGWLSVLRRAVSAVAGTGCTVSGTPGVDSLTGTGGADRICAFGGSDEIAGGGGKDVILAASGNDTANGGAGNDTIVAGRGADVVRGNDGRDFLNVRDGVHGNDRALGGPGSDTCRRDSGDAVASC